MYTQFQSLNFYLVVFNCCFQGRHICQTNAEPPPLSSSSPSSPCPTVIRCFLLCRVLLKYTFFSVGCAPLKSRHIEKYNKSNKKKGSVSLKLTSPGSAIGLRHAFKGNKNSNTHVSLLFPYSFHLLVGLAQTLSRLLLVLFGERTETYVTINRKNPTRTTKNRIPPTLH